MLAPVAIVKELGLSVGDLEKGYCWLVCWTSSIDVCKRCEARVVVGEGVGSCRCWHTRCFRIGHPRAIHLEWGLLAVRRTAEGRRCVGIQRNLWGRCRLGR